ncbi:helix-turn-helix domain-containing protein [Nocardia tengchongensis]|uniref:helix-turn-helix domain-containing protein n=1 Tax=Nocardia tengchongensis TaxID=2055889 RepID=UPI00361C9422
MSELVLQVPRARLRLRDSVIRDSAARPIDPDAASLTALRHILTGITKEGCPPAAADQLTGTILELLSAAVYSHADGRRTPPLSGEALLHATRAFMRRHLADPELDIEAVAKAHFISRRYLEVLFARAGDSPAAHLRGLRLDEARRRLCETSATITDVAFGVEFNDVDTFTRAFRRAHRLTPREWRHGHTAT